MSSLPYFNTKDINNLQENIMVLVTIWVRTENTPIPQKEILADMQKKGVKDCTVVNALNALLRKGYIRRSHTFGRETRYIQLRSV